MTEKQLKNLTRTDLMELLLEQTKRADELQERVTELTERIEELRAGIDRREAAFPQPESAAYSGAALQLSAPAWPESSLTEFVLEY